MATTSVDLRYKFFDYVFGVERGYVCICTAPPKNPRSGFKQHFFAWPEQKDKLGDFVDQAALHANVWFCVNLLSRAERRKEFTQEHNLVWCDLDTCDPDILSPQPSVVLESSPGRYQALWRLDTPVIPEIAQDYSKRVAYAYRNDGADPSGWDLTQLLRVPFTYNFKYADPHPQVKVVRASDVLVPVELFEGMEATPKEADKLDDTDLPDITAIPSRETVEYKYWIHLKNTNYPSLMGVEPDITADWSGALWRLINICLEAGMTDQEVLVCVLEAKCNKYARDQRPARWLWRDIKKASSAKNHLTLLTDKYNPLTMPTLVTEEVDDYLIDEYRTWATEATDAIPAYHDLAAFVVLSSIVAGNLQLEASYGTVIPNLWGLCLGDSTLTRKSTAMRLATDIMQEMDEDIILATDGSAEGILSSLSIRPGRVSVYFRDEVTGFFDSINRKDYLAGMPEILTHLYDVPRIFKRALRKETITITSPVFIFFGGGIRDKVYSLLNDEYVLSGFLPRFLVVSGDADLSRIRVTGPATTNLDETKRLLTNKFADIKEMYSSDVEISIAGQTTTIPAVYEVSLSPDAWKLYGEIEMRMVTTASESALPMLAMPTFERLTRSMLKMSMLLACSRKTPTESNQLLVEYGDVMKAATFIQDWGRYSVDLVLNTGKTTTQRILDKTARMIERHPDGIARGKIMQALHFTKREADEVLGTLLDRGEIVSRKEGKGTRYWTA